jgi:predicted kinase
MKKAIILMGLPCSGKTTWIKENLNPTIYTIISADEIKEEHSDYNPSNVTKEVHEWSVDIAERRVVTLSDKEQNFVLDGGSINNRYTMRIIKMLKEKDYHVKLVHVKTPYTVCLERNSLRERKVPEVAITDKALKEPSQFYKLTKLVDEFHVEDYFTNQNIFIDMDGVIAAQSCLPIINGEIDFANGEVHKWQKPVKPVIEKLITLDNTGHNLYILSATANSIAYDEKQEWLDNNFNIPRERRFFVNQGRHKAEMLDNLSRKFKLHKKDVLLIDDFHDILYKVRDRGMNSMHPSEFLTHEF